jgi:putative intracellular protease/amidase
VRSPPANNNFTGPAVRSARQRWREDAIADLLATEDADVLFVAGGEENRVQFHAQFDHIVLLSAGKDLDRAAEGVSAAAANLCLNIVRPGICVMGW